MRGLVNHWITNRSSRPGPMSTSTLLTQKGIALLNLLKPENLSAPGARLGLVLQNWDCRQVSRWTRRAWSGFPILGITVSCAIPCRRCKTCINKKRRASSVEEALRLHASKNDIYLLLLEMSRICVMTFCVKAYNPYIGLVCSPSN